MTAFRKFWRQLARNRSGVAMTEFAISAPFLMTAGLWAAETANIALVNLKVGQMAIQLADNASRIGDTSVLTNRRIYERDINDVFVGAHIMAGKNINFFTHGRAIISSLEVYDPDNDGAGPQWIHWQRCKGSKVAVSSYGNAGDGTTGLLTGMGPAGNQITAEPGEAVIFIEVIYDYQPMVANFLGVTAPIRATSSFTVRDSRDLSQIYQRIPAFPDPVASCGSYNASGLPVL